MKIWTCLSILALSLFTFSSCATQTTMSAATSLRKPQSFNANTGTDTIDPANYSKIFVISDVHGMYAPLLTLLRAGKVIDANNNWIAGTAALIIAGDSIDKGPNSVEVLDLWIQLQVQSLKAGGRVIHVLGNHEAEFLADPTNKKTYDLISELQSKGIPVTDLTSTTTTRGGFLHNEVLALKAGAWLFCHSGYYTDSSWTNFSSKAKSVLQAGSYDDDFLIGDNSILEAKDWEKDSSTWPNFVNGLSQNGFFGVVFGHQPGAFKIKARTAAKANGHLIKVDNGMAPEAGSNPGSLMVFTNPSQMNQFVYPDIQIIFPNGKTQSLIPE